MEITVFTLFPHWFDGPLGDSIIQRARDAGILDIRFVNFREFAADRHKSVDDAPYGGGGGMVLRADVLAAAMDTTIGPRGAPDRPHTILMSPRSKPFDQQKAISLAGLPRLAIVCGHYEGIDQRLIDTRIDEELSIGDFVLTGGEIPAMAIIDAVARMIPGVLGNEVSAIHESHMDYLIEGPQYTRPEVFEGHSVPDVLLSGNHAAIEAWREERALEVTKQARPHYHEFHYLHPAQIRKLGRRGKPFAIWTEKDGGKQLLAAPSCVTGLPDLEKFLSPRRAERGHAREVYFREIKEAGSGDSQADRNAMVAEMKAAVADLASGRHPSKGIWHPSARFATLPRLIQAYKHLEP